MLHLRTTPSIDFIVRELRLPTAATGARRRARARRLRDRVPEAARQPARLARLRRRLVGGEPASRSASIVLFDVGSAGISAGGARRGARRAAALVYVLAWRDGISGYRFILIGIGVSEFMLSIVGYMIAQADIYDAREAMTWLVGSVGQAGVG